MSFTSPPVKGFPVAGDPQVPIDFRASPYLAVRVAFTNADNWGTGNSGTISAAGVVTFGTALDRIYSEGIWWYFPASCMTAPWAAAGWYFVVMTSTTQGTVYEDKNLSQVCVGTGVGYTGSTAVNKVPGFVIPGRFLGPAGQVHAHLAFMCNNTAGTKQGSLRVKASTSVASTSQTTVTGFSISSVARVVQNQTGAMGMTMASSSSAPSVVSVDWTTDTPVYTGITVTTATDWLVCTSQIYTTIRS